MLSKINPVSRSSNIVIQKLAGELLIYDLLDSKAHCLNETSAMIWNLCDGNNSSFEISRKLSEKEKETVSEDFVILAFDQLKKANLFENAQDIPTAFDGMSRRDVIKRVGFASMIALPIVSSLIAPTAVSAQSICGCINPGNCITQTSCPNPFNCNSSMQCAP